MILMWMIINNFLCCYKFFFFCFRSKFQMLSRQVQTWRTLCRFTGIINKDIRSCTTNVSGKEEKDKKKCMCFSASSFSFVWNWIWNLNEDEFAPFLNKVQCRLNDQQFSCRTLMFSLFPSFFQIFLCVIFNFGKFFLATMWKIDDLKREKLAKFGQYCAECLPKFIQRVQVFFSSYLQHEYASTLHPWSLIFYTFNISISWCYECPLEIWYFVKLVYYLMSSKRCITVSFRIVLVLFESLKYHQMR